MQPNTNPTENKGGLDIASRLTPVKRELGFSTSVCLIALERVVKVLEGDSPGGSDYDPVSLEYWINNMLNHIKMFKRRLVLLVSEANSI